MKTYSGMCGCGGYHKFNIKTGRYEECLSCGCNNYPNCQHLDFD